MESQSPLNQTLGKFALALGKAENRALLLKAGMESFFLYFRD
jgi:hypothetical protein